MTTGLLDARSHKHEVNIKGFESTPEKNWAVSVARGTGRAVKASLDRADEGPLRARANCGSRRRL